MPRRPAPVIRRATASDAADIARIARESYLHLPARHVPADMPLYHPKHHQQGMQDAATRWALLSLEGRHVGFAMWRVLPGLAHLHMLFVSADYQGRGFGVRLLKHHHREAVREQPGTRLLTLHCLRESSWATRFYRHQGYTVYEPGDEGRHTDLYLWIDACKRYDNGWPLAPDKALLYRLTKG
ncbi:MAG TPA: GNAT family N-acetyltransferase [Chthonomonadales bacterium]|nr:GNAT family N-acetyltransferase [Chthonomonadales bacterium]